MLSRIARWLRAPEPVARRGVPRLLILALLLGALAGFLRLDAARTLPMDWDELVYLRVAYVYAHIIENGDWEQIARVPFNTEHPPLVKLIYGLTLSEQNRDAPPKPQPTGTPIPTSLQEEFATARGLSAWAGSFQVFVVALVNPLAGLFLALDSYHTRYTAEIMLEAIPGLFAVVAVALFSAAWRPARRDTSRRTLLASSALALGLAVSGKYTYAVAALAIAPFLLARARHWLTPLAYTAIALVTFVATNPALWIDPAESLSAVFSFHAGYSSDHGQAWWHPLALLAHLAHDDHHPEFFGPWTDRALLAFAVMGLVRAAHQYPVWFLWAVLGTLLLLCWPTKWAHYPLVVLPAFAVCAACGFATVADWVRGTWHQRRAAP